MTDRIELRGLRLLGHHGALPGEQDRAQPFEVDIDLLTDLGPAGRSDELGDTLDYGAVVALARDIIEQRRYRLIEAIADAIAEALLAETTVEEVCVTVRKLRPPVAADLATAAVRITRRRAAR